MSDHQALCEAMRRAAVDSQNATIRTRKTIGLVSVGLVVILAAIFFLLNVGPRSVRTSVPGAQAATRAQAASLSSNVASTASVDPKVAAAREVPAATDGYSVASAKQRRRHHTDDEESADN